MVIELVKDSQIWDNFVDQSPYGLLFHKWNFLKIVEKYTNFKMLPYGIYKREKLICIFPVFFKKYKGLKMIYSPPPYTSIPQLGFVMHQEFDILKQNKKDNYLNIVVEEFNKEIDKISPNYIYISLVSNFFDIRPFQWGNYIANIYFSHVIDLDISLDELWNGLDKDLRNEIKKAGSAGLKLLKSEDVFIFCELVNTRYKEQGLNLSINKNYLEELLRTYPDCLELYYLYDGDGNNVGNQINYRYKDTSMVWMGGIKTQALRNLKIYTNEYMIWESIKKAKNDGYKKFDWGGGTKTISQFKSKFNPTLETNFTLYKRDNLGKLAEWIYLNFIKK